MALRSPQNAFTRVQTARAGSPIESEIAAEKAAALGRSGRALADALAALDKAKDKTELETLLIQAAQTTQAYFIQRELIGIRDHSEIIREYDIPRAVLVRIGIMRPRPA